jgi:hypothetical protein
MTRREFHKRDLFECLNVEPGRIGVELVGRERALAAWRRLICVPHFCSGVVEADSPFGGSRIIGFGASVFVLQAFADDEVFKPRPGLNARIIASMDSPRPVVLNNAELRSGNTHGDLNLVVLYSSWLRGALDRDGVFQVHAHLTAGSLEEHAGYRINRVLMELLDESDRILAEHSPPWEVLSDFKEFYSCHQEPDCPWGQGRSLITMTRQGSRSEVGSLASVLFLHKQPVLLLRESDQELLRAALRGLTDEELSHRLNLGLAAVKRRWLSLFEWISEIRPDLLPDASEESDKRSRGRQKRHSILAYVRAHPEELRPYGQDRRSHHRTASPASFGDK